MIAAPIGFALLFCGVAIRQFYTAKSFKSLLSPFVLLVFAIAIYQSFLLFFFLAMSVLILFFAESGEFKLRAKIISLGKLSAFSIAAFLLSQRCIAGLVRWIVGIPQRLYNEVDSDKLTSVNFIIGQIEKTYNLILGILTGEDAIFYRYGAFSMGVFWFGVIALLIYWNGGLKTRLLRFVALLFCFILTFALIVYMGYFEPRANVQFAILYASVGAFACLLPNKSFAIVACSIALLTNTFITTSAFYTEKITRDRDRTLVTLVLEEMRQVEPKLGTKPIKIAIAEEFHAAPIPYRPRHHIIGVTWLSAEGLPYFLRYLGFKNIEETEVSIDDILEINKEKHPCFPAKGCVFYHNGILVVKFGKMQRQRSWQFAETFFNAQQKHLQSCLKKFVASQKSTSAPLPKPYHYLLDVATKDKLAGWSGMLQDKEEIGLYALAQQKPDGTWIILDAKFSWCEYVTNPKWKQNFRNLQRFSIDINTVRKFKHYAPELPLRILGYSSDTKKVYEIPIR
jgi:hypothetical protein